MSHSDLDPWNSQPPDWNERIHILALTLSQDPRYAALTAKDVTGCADRVVARIRAEVAGERELPPNPSVALVAARLRLCFRDKLRPHWDIDGKSDPLEDGDISVASDPFDPCVRCVQVQLEQARERDPALCRLAIERWILGKCNPPMTDAEKKRLSRLKAKIASACEAECEERVIR